MLIRLIPSASQPTVLFKLVFENLPDSLPMAWANQLAALYSDDLEIPELMHALDKAVGVQSILDQVTFDLVEQKIKCVLSDGESEEWDIASGYQGLVDGAVQKRKVDLVRRLDSVIDDVNQSALEMDKERKREERKREEEQRQQENAKEDAKPEEVVTVPTDQKRPRHKKQRSLLMNLVSSLIPLNLNSPRSPRSLPSASLPTSPTSSIRSSRSERLPAQANSAPTLFRAASSPTLNHKSPSSPLHSPLSSPAPLVIVGPPPPPPLSPRALRRRARSSLVDAFRLHVLPELTRRVRTSSITGSPVLAPIALYGSDTFAPYYGWIVGSTLKRVDARLSKIRKELRGEIDAIGIESSTLSLDALPGRGYITGPTTPNVQALSGPASGDSSEGNSSPRSGSEADWETESYDADSVSDSVTLIGSSLSVSGDDLAAFHYGQPKPTLTSSYDHPTPSVRLLPPPYLKMVSSTFDISTLTAIAPPGVSLPECLNDLLIQYNEFSTIHVRLVHLLLSVHARAAAAAADITQRETVLEVRGRRRAWLNRTLRAQDGSIASTKPNPIWGGAMGSPFLPSGLGKYSFTSDKWDCDPFHYLEGPRSHLPSLAMDSYPNPFASEADSYASLFTYRRKRSGTDTSVGLLPVCEEELTDGSETVGSFFYHKERRRYLDVEIDEDLEEEESSETDVDPLVDVELDAPGDDDTVFKKPSPPFLQIDAFKGSATLPKLSMDGKIIPKAVDPFDGESSLSTPLVMVAAANISKRMKNDIKTDVTNHVHPDE